MKQVLFEEDGAFRVGTILGEAGASFQVEAAHGKRSKVKAASILMRFDGQPLAAFIPEAQKLAEPMDPRFLWEVSGGDEFSFEKLAADYYGRAPTPQEATAVALTLHAHPMYFYRRGRGRYQAAPAENVKAALAGLERRRREQATIDEWAAELRAGRVPQPIGSRLEALLFAPDKTSLEWRALDHAAHAEGMAPPKLLARIGALAGPEDYFLRRFTFGFFPRGTDFPATPPLAEPAGLEESRTNAFSIDDEETTEIDDAFSVEDAGGGSLRVGIHIAAPAALFGKDHALEAIARERLSTVYFPGGKITMLPAAAVERATLAQGMRVPALSLYLTVATPGMEVTATETRAEWVRVAANLRLAELDRRMSPEAVAAGAVEGAHGESLAALWRLARALRALRGAGDERPDRMDYTFRIAEGRVAILPRPRGTPVDLVVAELMIHVNATWGRMLADRGVDAIYRNQRGARTRMEVEPEAHQWLGVTHYAWASSPLRRYSDLVNQRQLIASLAGDEPAYTREELVVAARDFETAYDAYAEHQRLIERYWTLSYLEQEGITSADGVVLREELVRIEGLPLVCRTLGLPPLAPGERVRVAFGEIDLWELNVPCRYAGK
jgi:exoribonuclease-2